MVRTCSSSENYLHAGVRPDNGCMSWQEEVHVFCTGDRCNGGDMGDLLGVYLGEMKARK